MIYKITGLNPQKKNPNRVNIYLDGEYSFSLSRIVADWLKVDQTISDEKILQLKKQDEKEKALQKALAYINYRPRSEKETRNKLEENGFSPESIDQVLRRLRDAEILDDEKFARDWIENRSIFRPRSQRLMAMELRHKGINDEAIDNAFEDSAGDEDLALSAARKRLHRLENLEWDVFRKKMSEYLMRRGFSYGTISSVVCQVWTERQSEKAVILQK